MTKQTLLTELNQNIREALEIKDMFRFDQLQDTKKELI